jgi:2-deoxy-D-gluconate 3-dehydrogenase
MSADAADAGKAGVRVADAYWDEVVATNLSAHFIFARELGRAMVARASGKIIFVTSPLAFQGGINVPGYAASKGGAGQLTMALAIERAGKGVKVNAIAPGYVATDNTEALRHGVSGLGRRRLCPWRNLECRWRLDGTLAGPISGEPN